MYFLLWYLKQVKTISRSLILSKLSLYASLDSRWFTDEDNSILRWNPGTNRESVKRATDFLAYKYRDVVVEATPLRRAKNSPGIVL